MNYAFEKRLEEVLLRDKNQNPKAIINLLKSDIRDVLENYMELTFLDVDFEVVGAGYSLKISASANHVKNVGNFQIN